MSPDPTAIKHRELADKFLRARIDIFSQKPFTDKDKLIPDTIFIQRKTMIRALNQKYYHIKKGI